MMTVEPFFSERLHQANQSILDAEEMLARGARSKYVLKRAYYAMMYGVLSLFEKDHIALETSHHSGVVSRFEEEYVETGRIDERYYRILSDMLSIREGIDRGSPVQITPQIAAVSLDAARQFLTFVKSRVSTLH